MGHSASGSLAQLRNIGGSALSKPSVCIFCDQVGKSKEHVLPHHWKETFPFSVGHSLRRRNLDGTITEKIRHNQFTSLDEVIRTVCQPCNSGWMNDMDSNQRTLIYELATGGAEIIRADAIEGISYLGDEGFTGANRSRRREERTCPPFSFPPILCREEAS